MAIGIGMPATGIPAALAALLGQSQAAGQAGPGTLGGGGISLQGGVPGVGGGNFGTPGLDLQTLLKIYQFMRQGAGAYRQFNPTTGGQSPIQPQAVLGAGTPELPPQDPSPLGGGSPIAPPSPAAQAMFPPQQGGGLPPQLQALLPFLLQGGPGGGTG